MFLPKSLYERAPQYWLFVGLLLIILGVYLGLEVRGTFFVIGAALGLASCLWGVHIMLRRADDRAGGDALSASSPTE